MSDAFVRVLCLWRQRHKWETHSWLVCASDVTNTVHPMLASGGFTCVCVCDIAHSCVYICVTLFIRVYAVTHLCVYTLCSLREGAYVWRCSFVCACGRAGVCVCVSACVCVCSYRTLVSLKCGWVDVRVCVRVHAGVCVHGKRLHVSMCATPIFSFLSFIWWHFFSVLPPCWQGCANIWRKVRFWRCCWLPSLTVCMCKCIHVYVCM